MSVCDIKDCTNEGLFRTRTRPTWCREHISTPFHDVGLELTESFTTKDSSYNVRCLTCGTESTYTFTNVLAYRDRGHHLCSGCLLVEQSALIHKFPPDGNVYYPIHEFILPAVAVMDGYEYLGPMVEARPLLNTDPFQLRCTTCQRVIAMTFEGLKTSGRHQCSGTPASAQPKRNPKTASVGTDYAKKANFLHASDHDAIDWWDRELNTEADWKNAKLKGRKSYHWVCPEGHRFTEVVKEMTQWGPRCPECTEIRRKQQEEERCEREAHYAALTISEAPELLAAWNDPAPAESTPAFDPANPYPTYRFICARGHKWNTHPMRFLEGKCPHCRSIETRRKNKEKTLADPTSSRLTPEITSQWHPTKNLPLTVTEISPQSRREVWWQDPVCGHEFQAIVRSRDKYERLRCPECETILDSLAFHYPDVAEEWSERNGELTPWHVRPTASKLETPPDWNCPTNPDHVWQAMPGSRVQGASCPMCQTVGTSKIEKTYAAAAADLWEKVEPGQRVRSDTFASHSAWSIDILVTLGGQRKLAIEYDGSYWHRDKFSVDTEKTRDLLAAGYLVCRLREQPLEDIELTDPNLVQLPVYWDADDPGDVILRIDRWFQTLTRD